MKRIVTIAFLATAQGTTGKEPAKRFSTGEILEHPDEDSLPGFVSFTSEGRTYEVAKPVFDASTTEKTPIALI